GDRQGAGLPAPALQARPAAARPPMAASRDADALLLRPLLRGAGDVDPRRPLLGRVVSRHPRRAAQPPRPQRPGRLVARPPHLPALPALFDGHGLHHPAGAEQLPADLAEVAAMPLAHVGAGLPLVAAVVLAAAGPACPFQDGKPAAPVFQVYTTNGKTLTGTVESLDPSGRLQLTEAKAV